MFYYNVENRNSPVSGEGLYTLDDIKKGSIVFYWGMDKGDKLISEEEYLEKRKDKSEGRHDSGLLFFNHTKSFFVTYFSFHYLFLFSSLN